MPCHAAATTTATPTQQQKQQHQCSNKHAHLIMLQQQAHCSVATTMMPQENCKAGGKQHCGIINYDVVPQQLEQQCSNNKNNGNKL